MDDHNERVLHMYHNPQPYPGDKYITVERVARFVGETVEAGAGQRPRLPRQLPRRPPGRWRRGLQRAHPGELLFPLCRGRVLSNVVLIKSPATCGELGPEGTTL